MKNWNRTGKIKAIILAIVFLLDLFTPTGVTPLSIAEFIMTLIFGSLAVPLIMKFYEALMGRELSKPNWNDNPFTFKKPLIMTQFAAFFFLAVGISMLLGTAIRCQKLNGAALPVIGFGLGILIGIQFAVKWAKK